MDDAHIARLLDAARDLIATRDTCWFATHALEGGAHARAVRIGPSPIGRDGWTKRFLCRRQSRKAAEIARDPLVTLAFQDAAGDTYVALGGPAALIEDNAEMRRMWPASLDAHYPPGWADANMVVVRIEVDRVEIHARGLTREPFGHGRTLLQRTTEGGWRYEPD